MNDSGIFMNLLSALKNTRSEMRMRTDVLNRRLIGSSIKNMSTYFNDEEYIEREVEKVEKDVYGDQMPVHNKNTLRSMLKKEIAHERYTQNIEDQYSKWAGA